MALFNYSSSPFIPGFDIGNMAMIQGNFMPSNPQFVGAGANKNFNPYIKGKFMPSNPDFVGVGAPRIRPESNIYGDLKKNYRTGEGLINDEQNPSDLSTSDTVLPTSSDKERKIFEERKKKVVKNNPEYRQITQEELDNILKNLPDDTDYGKMTKYAESVIGKIDEVAQKARERDFFREGVRSFANAPLIGAQANLEAAKNIADLTALNMGAMAAQNRVLENNPTKQKIAGKYFR
tara:strand:+ start:45 stop:749 length:705 start_codon:yes stop_codon:yes gene_type:complete